MLYIRRNRHYVYWWMFPFIGIWWIMAVCVWVCVFTLVWSYEAYVGASIRAYHTTRAVFDWPPGRQPVRRYETIAVRPQHVSRPRG